MNYYSHHLGDYAKDAGHLTMMEHGAYRMLLDRYYGTEKPLPVAEVYRVCRASSKQERAAVDSVVREFFTEQDGALYQNRVQREIEIADHARRRSAENGRKGGRPQKPEKTQQVISGYENETQKKASQSPTSNHQSPTSLPTLSPSSGAPPAPKAEPEREIDDFVTPEAKQAEAIVRAYPANGNRYEAQAAVLRAIRAGDSPQLILERVQAHAECMKRLHASERRFCPGLATYFSEGRWNDDPAQHPWTVAKAPTREEQERQAKKGELQKFVTTIPRAAAPTPTPDSERVSVADLKALKTKLIA